MQKTQCICIPFLKTCLYFRRVDIWFSTVGSWRRILLTRRSICSWGRKVPEKVVILSVGIKALIFSWGMCCLSVPANKPWVLQVLAHQGAAHSSRVCCHLWLFHILDNSSSDAECFVGCHLKLHISCVFLAGCWAVRRWAVPQCWVHTPVYFLFGAWLSLEWYLLWPPVQHSLP